jgi:hypothetical protein
MEEFNITGQEDPLLQVGDELPVLYGVPIFNDLCGGR